MASSSIASPPSPITLLVGTNSKSSWKKQQININSSNLILLQNGVALRHKQSKLCVSVSVSQDGERIHFDRTNYNPHQNNFISPNFSHGLLWKEMLDVMQFTQFLCLKMMLHLSKKRFAASICHIMDKSSKDHKWQFRRRHLCIGASLVAIMTLNQGILSVSVRAEDRAADKQEDDGGLGAIKSLFDPNEKTKSGKVLPKAYLKSAREVVKTLRESLNEDPKDSAKFRRGADAAKESIRDYLSNWKGQQTVLKEESYVELEKVFRSLASFYAKAGPSASITDEVKSNILHNLDAAEEFL